MIGIICAIPEEINHLSHSDDFRLEREIRISKFIFRLGKIGEKRVVLAECGMGKVNAALITTLLVENFECETVIFSGIAGGLDPELKVGDVVIAEKSIQWDYGSLQDRELQIYQPGYLPFYMPTDTLGYEINPDYLKKIKDCLTDDFELPLLSNELTNASLSTNTESEQRKVRLSYGTILTGDQFINCPETRRMLFEKYGAQAVEMEGAAIAQVCEALSVNCILIRALSDLAGEESSFDFLKFMIEVGSISAKIVKRLIGCL